MRRHIQFCLILLLVAGCLPRGHPTAVKETPALPGPNLRLAPVWRYGDDGHFITAESTLLKVRFAYNAANYDGWYRGTGGTGGSLVELYYKPLDPQATRNLLFANGTYGSGYANMSGWEAENTCVDGAGFNAPDYVSNKTEATRLTDHAVYESAGRLFVSFDMDFGEFDSQGELATGWHIHQVYILHPWGRITHYAELQVAAEGPMNYLGHRFTFAGTRYSFTKDGLTYEWGTNYTADGEYYHMWSDGYAEPDFDVPRPRHLHYRSRFVYGKQECMNPWQLLRRFDQWSGFLIDDRNGNDPDIMVIQGRKDNSGFWEISRRIEPGYLPLVDGCLWNTEWATPSDLIGVGHVWFYMTTPIPDYATRGYWSKDLGSWPQLFHIFLRQDLSEADYLPLWREAAHLLDRQEPFDVHGATVHLDETQGVYHLVAEPGAREIRFRWRRGSDEERELNYHTPFVVEGFGPPAQVVLNGQPTEKINVYYSAHDDRALVELDFGQSAARETYEIRLVTGER